MSWAAGGEGDDALTMRGIKHNGNEKLTLLELALRVQGEFRRNLEPIRVTPLQAGVILYLQRHKDAKLTDAVAALRVTLPTLNSAVKSLVRKRWVTKRRSAKDDRVVHLRLSRRGEAGGTGGCMNIRPDPVSVC